MAFPGGKGEGGDRNFHDIAARETFEETGLEVTDRHYIGAELDPDTHRAALDALLACGARLVEAPPPEDLA